MLELKPKVGVCQAGGRGVGRLEHWILRNPTAALAHGAGNSLVSGIQNAGLFPEALLLFQRPGPFGCGIWVLPAPRKSPWKMTQAC